MTEAAQKICDTAAATLRAGDGYAALTSYARAIALVPGHACTVPDDADEEATTWCRRLLLLGAAAAGDAVRMQLAGAGVPAPTPPVCLVAGTTDPSLDVTGAEALLCEAFDGFSGTLISGGTDAGVAGLVATIGQVHDARLTTVGYVPRDAPGVDHRYHQVRTTNGSDFSPWEALQAWSDLLGAAVSPASVTLLGLGGGRISAVEYRIALALGARVGIVRQLGRAGAQLLADPHWKRHPQLVDLAWDAAAVRRFVARTPTHDSAATC